MNERLNSYVGVMTMHRQDMRRSTPTASDWIKSNEIARYVAEACTPGELRTVLSAFQPEARRYWTDMMQGKRLITGALYGREPVGSVSYREMMRQLDGKAAAGRVRDRKLDGLVAGKV